MRDTDRALVQAASAVAKLRCRSAMHTHAAAARTADGRVISGVNLVHGSAGACAEVIVIATAATQGVADLETLVTVEDRGRSLHTPCESCRQLLAERFPALRVIIGPAASPRVVLVGELPAFHAAG